MEAERVALKDEIRFQQYIQFLFFEQWFALKQYANAQGVQIIGDIPIYVAMDSVDTWGAPELFLFNSEREPLFVGGCPPDYFSGTGQLWGNPIFNYARMAQDGFQWWIDRLRSNLSLYDLIRVDHFRGFAGYWSIPYGEETAINGTWETGPGKALFDAIKNALGDIPIIAEDLGLITPDVIELRDHFHLPGMKILQFAFDSSEDNNYLPHTYDKNCVVYTGTHDNDTVVGWFNSAKESDQQYVLDYFNSDGKDIAWDFIRGAWSSVAALAMAPMQDVLALDGSARMNLPGTTKDNWLWRMPADVLQDEKLAERLYDLTKLYGRL
ncbi:MAG: 4-alpha-glucanotransferase [Chitinophagales bacterium]